MSLVLIISVTVCTGALGLAIGLVIQLRQRNFWLLSGLQPPLLVMQATALSASQGLSPAPDPGSWLAMFAHHHGQIAGVSVFARDITLPLKHGSPVAPGETRQ